jgi:AbrB family looped-hinge helix DNA binding protein
MARVTSKLQVSVPKAIADQFAIRPGDEIDWIPAGDGIRVVKRMPAKRKAASDSVAARLRQFDQATRRQALRNKQTGGPSGGREQRGWTREDLYRRGRSR